MEGSSVANEGRYLEGVIHDATTPDFEISAYATVGATEKS